MDTPPDDKGRIVWDGIISCLSVISMVFVPLDIAFELSDPERGADISDIYDWPPLLYMVVVLDVFFILDVFVNLRTAYTVDIILIKQTKLVCANYLRSWLAA